MVGEPLLAAMGADEYAPEKAADYYPPALTGMRGNHDGTFTYRAPPARRRQVGCRLARPRKPVKPTIWWSSEAGSAAWPPRISTAKAPAATRAF